MVSEICYVAELPEVVIRRRPTLSSDKVSLLRLGDEITASDVFLENGIEWVKLAKGSFALRSNGSQEQVSLEISHEGFVAMAEPSRGSQLRKREKSSFQERTVAVLSKSEIQEVLAMSSDPGLQLPLEVKYWTRQQLEMFVLSGGVLRPKNCSIPDERLMANTKMSRDQVLHSLSQAAEWMANADAILIGSGAGMGVDSGLGTFRGGHRGVWDGLESVGLAYEEICEPRWFNEDPRLGWGFWNHCHKIYQETKPHEGYRALSQLGKRCPFGFFSFTSNIDSHWITSGMVADRVLEVHGAVRWLQCSKPCCPDVWKAPSDLGLTEDVNHRVQGELPTCPKCKAVARPNVQMFGGDSAFSRARRGSQNNKYDAWIKAMAERPDASSLRIVCLEVGCGLTVPTVRKELEKVMLRFPGARLVRVNPENPGISPEMVDRGVSLPLPAAEAIEQLTLQVTQADESMQATCILRGDGGACEFRAPFGTCLGRLLRLAQRQVGMNFSWTQDLTAHAVQTMGSKSEKITADRSIPIDLYQEVKRGEGDGIEVMAILIVDAKISGGSNSVATDGYNLNPALAKRLEQVSNLLDEMNLLFSDPAYQAAVRKCEDKKSVIAKARAVQFKVLPKYGIEASERGTAVMASWIGAVQSLGLQQKVDASMHLSYFSHMAHLPLVKAATSVAPQATPAVPQRLAPAVAASAPPEAPKEEPKAATKVTKEEKPTVALAVTVTRFSTWDDDAPQRLQLDCMSNTKILELRGRLVQILSLDEKEARQMKLIKRKRAGFVTAEDKEFVSSEVFVHNIDKWPGA